VDTTDERWYAPELYRLKGELLLQLSSDNQAEAENCFQQAMTVAQNQGLVAHFGTRKSKASGSASVTLPVGGLLPLGELVPQPCFRLSIGPALRLRQGDTAPMTGDDADKIGPRCGRMTLDAEGIPEGIGLAGDNRSAGHDPSPLGVGQPKPVRWWDYAASWALVHAILA